MRQAKTHRCLGKAGVTWRALVAFMFGVLLTVGTSANAQLPTASAPPLETDIGRAADRIFGEALAGRRINAAAVVFVRNGKVEVNRTYGFEDLARSAPLSPEQSRLPIASVSKGFTGLAIAQLVASGRIRSVDDPVNLYLRGFQVPGPWGDRLTVRHLLTHQGGFDEVVYGAYTDHLNGRQPEAADYRAALPMIVRAPGELTAYSNRGASLLGAVIEGASGERFPDYLQRHVLRPAGMTTSLAIYKTPVAHQVTVYRRSLDQPPSLRGPVYSDAISVPAGGIAVTAADMGRFMTAILAPAEDGPLNKRVVQTAFAPLHATNAGVQSHAMLFETLEVGGRRVVHHGGSLPGSQSWLFLFPDTRDGLFVFISDWQVRPSMPFEPSFWTKRQTGAVQPMGITEATAPLREIVLKARPVLAISPLAVRSPDPNDATAFVGLYRGARKVEGTMLKFMGVLFPDVLDIKSAPDGGLTVNGQGPFVPIRPAVYADPKTGQRIGFAKKPSGKILATYTFRSSDYVRVARWTDPRPYAQVWWIAIGLSLTGLGALIWPVSARRERLAKFAAASSAICAIAVPLALFAWDDSGYQFLFNGGPRLITAKVFANTFIVLAPVLVLLSVAAWRGRLWTGVRHSVFMRLHLMILAIAAALLFAGYAWVNFLGLSFP